MRKIVTMQLAGVGLLLVGVLVGIAGAQAVQNQLLQRFMNTGLFSVESGQKVRFNVSLDDRQTAAPATVLLQLFNANGEVVKQDEVALKPGHSATLELEADKPDRYRAHARIIDSALPLGARRTFAGTAEIIDDIKAETKFVCSIYDDVADPLRPQ